ncbi:LacI family DNA-binding transcriptional regulator [Mariniflexile litorale]|uniref:LacI family DNA-binding transcriptional regulator n=1 Tax=Mariniflexile litorale TaxID=3045158 RepID=A0AAU7EHN7_9FLAO|nr:LacI family DNA-binding transcriptional regulator [Mariniflexile sp. KMM 9835]MDQ8209961.1 LacI family DNA-binding transcriptional regulator [Mariniflexile sp. KMM 9835]
MDSDERIIGIKDVAKAANVALATVDRVIHNRAGVSKKTKDKVLKVIEKMGYQPNIMASNLSKSKKIVLGVLLPNISEGSGYWEFPMKGIVKAQKELSQYRIKIKTFTFKQDNNKEIRKKVLELINSDIQGLVLTSKFADEIEILLEDCKEKKRPYVFIDSNVRKIDSLCSIQQPLFESGELAAQLFNYCFNKGEILILHLKDTMDTEGIIGLKEKGMNAYLKEKNNSIVTKSLVITDFNENAINRMLTQTLEENPMIKGVFIPNSKVAYIAKYFEKRAGEKIYLIGYDFFNEDIEYLEKEIIDFLICQRPEEQGYQAVYKLFEHVVLKKEVEKEIIMPLDIITKKNYKYY